MKKTVITTTLRPQYNEKLAEMAAKEGLSKGSMIEKLIDEREAKEKQDG